MKVVVTAKSKNGLDSEVDPRFGRANYFAVVDTDNMEVNFLENDAADSSSGAGVRAAQLIADQNAEAVLAGSFGPKAFNTLSAAGIKIYSYSSGTIAGAVDDFKNNCLKELTSASNNGHVGLK
ncbi:MAG: NifB/NifX family molybdenum-iron cluster-binding protein [Halanaerobiales bacterium]